MPAVSVLMIGVLSRVPKPVGYRQARVRDALAQRAERGTELGREQLGFFPGGEVAAPGGFVEVGEGGVALLDPAAWGAEGLAGEHREPDRELDRRRGLPGREGCGLSVFPVRPG